MKKNQMFFYAAAVIGFYCSLILLYINTASVLGTALLCMSILMLVLGVFVQWKSANQKGSWYQAEPAVEAAKTAVSC